MHIFQNFICFFEVFSCFYACEGQYIYLKLFKKLFILFLACIFHKSFYPKRRKTNCPTFPKSIKSIASCYRISPCLRYKQWIPFRCIFFTYPFKIRKVYIRSKNIYAFCNISPYFFISRYRSS